MRNEKQKENRALYYILWFDDSVGWFSGVASVYCDSLQNRLNYISSGEWKDVPSLPSVEVVELIEFKSFNSLHDNGKILFDVLSRRLDAMPSIRFTSNSISLPTGAGGCVSFIILSKKEYTILKRANELQDFVDEYYALLKGLN